MRNSHGFLIPSRWGGLGIALIGALSLLIGANQSSAQITTNAFDVASNSVYAAGAGGGNNLGNLGSPNGGFGFSGWTFSASGGGAFITTDGGAPSGKAFDFWNNTGNSATIAVRPFSSSLFAGESFSVVLRNNSLANGSTSNMMVLEDSSGNQLFSYWHIGGDNGNGHYTDGTVTNGAAVNFPYAFNSFQSFTFTLNSPTTYTFKDNTSGTSFSGFLSGTAIAQAAFVRGNTGAYSGGGQDFEVDQLMITASGQIAPPSFNSVNPAPNTFSVVVTNAISAEIIPGGASINSGSISLTLNGSGVTPVVTSAGGGAYNVSYQPGSPLSAGTSYSVSMIVEDANNNFYTNAWSFTTGHPSLPAVLAGPITTGNGVDVTIFTAAGEGWMGTNYSSAGSSRTLYTRYSMEFSNLNGKPNNTGFGGLQFFIGSTEELITGDNSGSTNWSYDAKTDGEFDLNIANSTFGINLGEWHTIVIRSDYVPNNKANVTIYFDPDFTQPEASQNSQNITHLTTDVSFDNVRLRCGNGTASATWTNIIVGALSTDVGFAAPVSAYFQDYIPGQSAPSAYVDTPISVQVVVGSVGINTNSISMTLDSNPVTPTLSVSSGIITISYQPPSHFVTNSTHSVAVNLTDTNGTPYSTSWSFTMDSYPTLPVTIAGPIDVGNGGLGVTIFGPTNEWLGVNYEASSTNTLYTRFSMTFFDLNSKPTGLGFGGLQFWQDGTEHLITGDNSASTNWSLDCAGGGGIGEADLLPVTPIVLDPGDGSEYHTIVIKSVYSSNAPTAETIWLDPDFTKSEVAQPQAPLTFTTGNTFDYVRVRAGNGTAAAEFSNIVVAATSPGVGFAPSAPPIAVMSVTSSGGVVNLSWTSTGTLQQAPAVTGPWTTSVNQSNPQVLVTTNSALFFRLSQ